MKRSGFLTALAAAGLAPALIGAAGDEAMEPLQRALVLSGGGARGAYEAGAVGELVAAAGIGDGAAVPPYEVVCGTSIGALNGWFVATGQYSRMRELWYTIGGQDLMRLKPRYAALHDPESGILNRAASAIGLIGLVRNQRAVLESEPVFGWITEHVDPQDAAGNTAGLGGHEPDATAIGVFLRSAEAKPRSSGARRARAQDSVGSAYGRPRSDSRHLA